VNKQKKNFKSMFVNSMFSKGEFYIKISLILLIATIFIIIFVNQNGILFFESYPYADKFRNNDFQVHFIDVGNGDAILIKFHNDETMMIDTGDEYYENKLSSYIQQYLWSENLKQIDYLVLTHPDSDHVGGAKAILEKFKVKNLYRPKIYSTKEYQTIEDKQNYNVSETKTYNEAIDKAYSKKCNLIFNEDGLLIKSGDAKVEFLAPLYNNYSETNNYSAIIKITYQSKSFLFMGDADTSIEEQLIDKYGSDLKADVLKAGHHGSKTSSSAGFLRVVSPQYTIFSCKASSYYPNDNVLENVKAVNSKMLTTGIRGSFAMSVEDGEIVYANAEKSTNYLALLFTIFILLIFIIWENPFKKIKPLINKIKND